MSQLSGPASPTTTPAGGGSGQGTGGVETALAVQAVRRRSGDIRRLQAVALKATLDLRRVNSAWHTRAISRARGCRSVSFLSLFSVVRCTRHRGAQALYCSLSKYVSNSMQWLKQVTYSSPTPSHEDYGMRLLSPRFSFCVSLVQPSLRVGLSCLFAFVGIRGLVYFSCLLC